MKFIDILLGRANQPVMEMARRSKMTIFLDEHIHSLENGLIQTGFKVVMMAKRTQDPKIQEKAEGWAICTKDVDDFRDGMVAHDYDIISIKNVKFIDNDPTANNVTVKKIAKAVRNSHCAEIRGKNFILHINDDASFRLEFVTI